MKLVDSITEEFYYLTGIHHCIIPSYHPQANVQFEQQNRTMEYCIHKYANESQSVSVNRWHVVLGMYCKAFFNKVKSLTYETLQRSCHTI